MKTLTKYHPWGDFRRNAQTNTWTINGDFKMVPGVSGVGYALGYHETYFDLAGMSMEEKTLFFEAADVQTTFLPSFTGPTVPGDRISVWDIMSSVPIDVNGLQQDVVYGFGFPGSRQDFTEIIYGRVEQFIITMDVGNFGSPIQVNSENFSSGSPSASDRIYSYRFIEVALTDQNSTVTAGQIPPARHILSASAKEEPDYVYMMRLMRSYRLQQEPDED